MDIDIKQRLDALLKKIEDQDSDTATLSPGISPLTEKLLLYLGVQLDNLDITTELEKLKDVEIEGPAHHQALVYDAEKEKWVNDYVEGGAAGATKLDELTDVHFSGLEDGESLVYDSASDKWINKMVDTSIFMEDIVDTDIEGPRSGQVLVYDGDEITWKNSDALISAESKISALESADSAIKSSVESIAARATALETRAANLEQEYGQQQASLIVLSSQITYATHVAEGALGNETAEYQTNIQYFPGDYCTYQYGLYRCIGNTSGAWNNAKWERVKVCDEIKLIKSSADNAVETANNAASSAASAWDKAESAMGVAASAMIAVASALESAGTAYETAQSAASEVSEAVNIAGNALTSASSAYTKAQSAITTAASALDIATSAAFDAGVALSTASDAMNTASSAVTTANSAMTAASSAVSTASSAISIADNAASLAATAVIDASEAKSSAQSAYTMASVARSSADVAYTTASSALNKATTAQTTAGSAVEAAEAAQTTASNALTTANSATTAASSAVTTASSALGVANIAATDASMAVQLAQAAAHQAATAAITADSALTDAATAVTTANTAATEASDAYVLASDAIVQAGYAERAASRAETAAENAEVKADQAKTSAFSALSVASDALTTASNAYTLASNALPKTTKYGSSISASINTMDYKVTITLKDQDGNTLGTAQIIDLPLESVVVNGSFDSENKKIILTLQNGNTVDIPVGDLVAGLQTEITLDNKLDADLVSDFGQTHKFVTSEQISKLSGIESGAEVNVQADWSVSDSTSDAFIKNKPTIPAAQVNSDWNSASGVSKILNKPMIPDKLADLSDDSTHRLVSDTEKVKWNATSVFKELATEDLDNVKEVGFYVGKAGNTCANKPSRVVQFGLEVVKLATDAQYYKQILIRPTNQPGDEYVRTCYNGTWQNWKKRADFSGSYDDLTDKPTIIDEKVKIANDTSSNQSLRILLGTSNNDDTVTESVKKSSPLLFNPSTGVFYSPRVVINSKEDIVPFVIRTDGRSSIPQNGDDIALITGAYKKNTTESEKYNNIISLIGNTTDNRSSVRFGSSTGATIITAGGNAKNFPKAYSKYASDALWLAAQSEIHMYTNLTTNAASEGGHIKINAGGITVERTDSGVGTTANAYIMLGNSVISSTTKGASKGIVRFYNQNSAGTEAFYVNLDTNTLSENRSIHLPNASGTIQLQSTMSVAELTTGTATTSRTMRADTLKSGIQQIIDERHLWREIASTTSGSSFTFDIYDYFSGAKFPELFIECNAVADRCYVTAGSHGSGGMYTFSFELSTVGNIKPIKLDTTGRSSYIEPIGGECLSGYGIFESVRIAALEGYTNLEVHVYMRS